jgi:hypothetical protein
MEALPLKAIYALVLCLFSFAAAAQTLEASLAPYFIDDPDCLGETPGESTTSRQNAAEPPVELLCEIMLLEDRPDRSGHRNAEDIPVGAIAPEPGDPERRTLDPESRQDDGG